jgi:hypothetical protein
MRRIALPLLLLALAAPATSHASGDDVLRDCGDDEKLSKRYSQQEYLDALDNISADIRQYTNCQAVIRQAQLSAASGGRGGAGGAGSSAAADAATLAAATPEQKRELAEAVSEAPAPVTLPGAGPVDPASAGEVPGIDAVGELPTPLGILLALMAAGALALGLNRIRSRGGRRRPA